MADVMVVVNVLIGLVTIASVAFSIWMSSGWRPSRRERRERPSGESPFAVLREQQTGWISKPPGGVPDAGWASPAVAPGATAAPGAPPAAATLPGPPPGTGLAGRALVGKVEPLHPADGGGQHLRIHLTVDAGGRASYELDHEELVPVAGVGRLHTGASLPVRVDPNDPNRVSIDLDQF